MAQFEKHFVQDLTKDLKIRQCGTIVFNADNLSNVVSVDLYNGSTPATPTGTVVGAVICSDGSTVPITNGTISGNTVSITLTQACFAIAGQIGVGIQLVNGNIKTTVLKAIYNAERFTTDEVIDPNSRITISVADLVNDIAEAVATIPASYSDLMAAVAPTFSASTAYTAGQYVWYNGNLYRFTAAHSAGAWNASHVTAAVISNELSDLKSATLALESDNATTVPSNSDFNDYLTPGNYKVLTIDVSKTIANIPYESSGRLTVARTTQSDRIMQIYWVNSAVNIFVYYRFFSGSSWSDWIKLLNSDELSQTVALATIRDFYPRSNNAVSFTRSGTSIVLTVPSGLAHYLKSDASMVEKSYAGGVEITVPHDSFAIFNISSGAVEVKTLAQLQAMTAVSYIPLFYNSNGNVHGLFEKYAILEKINSHAEMYFYGINAFPRFQFLSDYSINVTIPANARVNYYDYTTSPPLFKDGISTNIAAQTINVPHDNCLVYDISTRTISIESYNFNYDKNKVVLFYNSHGVVNGQWYKYYLRQLINEAQTGYPAYFESHLVSRLDEANLILANSGVSGIVFITDHHYPSNSMISKEIVKTVCNQSGIDKVFLGGDYINRETAKADALRNINRIGSMYEYPGVKTFRMCGNHEFNNPGASSDETIVANQLSSLDLRHAILNTFQSDVVYDLNSLSYYYDDDINKIRYLVGSVDYMSRLDSVSVKWVADQLLTVPSGYSVVVMFHTILSYSNGTTSVVNSAQNLIAVLDALKAKTTCTFDGSTYDFSAVDTELICAICGDMHVDTDYTTSGGVHIIATTTDSMQELGSLTRNTGETSEVAFDVFLFDTVQKEIHCIRIGAGESREYSY